MWTEYFYMSPWKLTWFVQIWNSTAANLGMAAWRGRLPSGVQLATNATLRESQLALDANVSWRNSDGCGFCYLATPCPLHAVTHPPPDLLPSDLMTAQAAPLQACAKRGPWANASLEQATLSTRLAGGDAGGASAAPAWAQPAFQSFGCAWAHRLRRQACAPHDACPFELRFTRCRRQQSRDGEVAGQTLERLQCSPERGACDGSEPAAAFTMDGEEDVPVHSSALTYCRSSPYNKHATVW